MEQVPNQEEEKLLVKARNLLAEAEEFVVDLDIHAPNQHASANDSVRHGAISCLARILDTLNLAEGRGFKSKEIEELRGKVKVLFSKLNPTAKKSP